MDLPSTARRSPPPEVLHVRPGQLRVRFSRPGSKPRIKNFTSTRVTCGRSKVNDLVLDDDSLSASHFSLEFDANGLRLNDCASTNGTWLRGTRVSEVWVSPGSTFTAGDYQFEVLGTDSVQVSVLTTPRFHGMLGESSAIREIFARIVRLAGTDLDLFIEGETGTGKEMVARALHAESSRVDQPFVVLDCAWLSSSLAEESIFGHVKGAYTQAHEDCPGCFEVADGGTLFIDEIGELPLDLQLRLLRVLDRREVQRLGERRCRKVDVRVVAATNRDLRQMVGDGAFREDLYYRLVEEIIRLPPLRSRDSDIDYIADGLLEKFSLERGITLSLSEDTRVALRRHSWPGNVRELYKVLRRSSRLAPEPTLAPKDIRLIPAHAGSDPQTYFSLPLTEAMAAMEKEYLARLMEDVGGNLTKAGEVAGLTRKGVRDKLKKFGLYRGR
ncbi:MAG: sigma 54-interacting transcriptional regulator [Myxococcota bacterium]